MKYETISITPEVAAEWLQATPDFQRKLRETVVTRYARDMINGEWNLTHQGVAFDTKGRLIDGQHRLAAIVKAGVSVVMTVVRDAPATAYDHVDIGLARTTADVLKAQGAEWITPLHIATSRFMECGTNIRSVNMARSPFELRDMVETHKNALTFVFQNIERHVRGITIAPVLAAIAVAYYTEMDRHKLAGFLRLLVSGISQDPARDSTVIRLRDWLRDQSGNVSTTARYDSFMKTQRVIKAYMNDEHLSKLYTPSEPCYVLKRRAVA